MIASPCIDVCKMDEASGLCLGCWRTLAEISAWGAASDDERQMILAAVARRRVGHNREPEHHTPA